MRENTLNCENCKIIIIVIRNIFIVELVLKQEQEEYQKEGIAWQNIEYFNNQIICDLVEQAHKGIIAIMDEACLNVGKVTDEVIERFILLWIKKFFWGLKQKILYSLDASQCNG